MGLSTIKSVYLLFSQAIHDAEAELDLAKVKFDRMQRQLATAKLKIREQMKNNAGIKMF